DIVEAIVSIRRQHPRWGPRKLLVVLRRHAPERRWPVASTVGDILRRAGMVRPRRRRRVSVPYGERLADYSGANAIWCADFKGHFAVGGARCHPLTIMDGFSRYLLRCDRLARPLTVPAQKVFESAFPRVWVAYDHPYRQRGAVFNARPGRPVAISGVVDSPRHPS